MHACAESWGLEDVWGGVTRDVQPFSTASSSAVPGDVRGEAAAWKGVGLNTPQPQLLAARQALRREMVDLGFRCGLGFEWLRFGWNL